MHDEWRNSGSCFTTFKSNLFSKQRPTKIVVGLFVVKTNTFERCKAAATVMPFIVISQRVANDLDTLHSVLKISTRGSIPVCKCQYLLKFVYFFL